MTIVRKRLAFLAVLCYNNNRKTGTSDGTNRKGGCGMSKRIETVKQILKQKILQGEPGFLEGTPSIRELTALLNESRHVAAAALKELEEEKILRKRDARERIAVKVIVDDLGNIRAVELSERDDSLRAGELFERPGVEQNILHGIIISCVEGVARGVGDPFHQTAPRKCGNIVGVHFPAVFEFHVDPLRVDERDILDHDGIRFRKHGQFRTDLVDAVLHRPFSVRVIERIRPALGSRPERIAADVVEELAARNGDRGVPDTASPHSAHLAAGQLLPDRRIERLF